MTNNSKAYGRDWEHRRQRHRRNLACLLLITFCLQRLLGILGSHLMYAVEVAVQMDQPELELAEKIRAEAEVDVQVEILDDDRLEQLQQLGYSSPFIFSEEIDGEAVYYTIDQARTETVQLSLSQARSPDPTQLPQGNKLLTSLLLSKFFFWEQAFHLSTFTNLSLPGTTVPHFVQVAFLPVHSPPPKLA